VRLYDTLCFFFVREFCHLCNYNLQFASTYMVKTLRFKNHFAPTCRSAPGELGATRKATLMKFIEIFVLYVQ
jgi:hypothetical protein